jgi:alpha-D-xyloside xylohydrolase
MMEYKIEDNRIRWAFKGEEVLAEVCGTESIRVRASFGSPVDEKRNYNLKKSEDLEGKACLTKEGAVLCAGNLRAEIYDEGRVTFYYRDKKILKEMWIDEKSGMPPFQRAREYKGISGERFHIQTFFEPSEEEHIYGMGQENTGCFDLKGCTVDLCQKNTKCTIPFYISTLGYGFVWNNPAVGRAEFVKNRTLWEARMSRQLDYVVIGGGEPRRIMEYYTELTGRMPAVPDWIFGLWQSRLRYRTQRELLEVAQEYRRRKIPLSVIVLDYFHWPYQGDWRFDEEYFPDPGAMAEELDEAGVRLMVSVWPTVDRRSENYRNLEELGGLITSERGPDVLFMCRGAETYVDMTNPEAADVLWEKLRDNYVEYGISSFWLDEAEPEIYPYDYENMRLRIGNGLEESNYYPYAYSDGVEERLRADNIWSVDGDRQTDGINLVRSGWIGSQRLRAVIWSGDVPSTFKSFKNQLAAGLHMSMCGIPLWTTDIGGFYGGDPEEKEFRELMIRWFQFGTFCPVMRMHGYRKPYVEKGNMDDMSGECSSGGPNEIWSFGEEAYGIMLNYIQIRERMIPYIKEQLAITRRTGTPIMRPLVYDYPGDANV